MKIPKTFISYSWSSSRHEKWVLNLAEKLRADGINVVIDKWDLKPGQDKYEFMEQMVNDKTVDRVLVICDRQYKEKADDRKGGVGTETQIISKEIYDSVNQEKFIPIISERDEKNIEYLPIFMQTRIYIDLSNDTTYFEEYEKLIRNIFNKPANSKPPIGTPPSYIMSENDIILKTSHKVERIKNSLITEKGYSSSLIIDYFYDFKKALEDFRIDPSEFSNNSDEVVIKCINSYIPYRNDFYNLIHTIIQYNTNKRHLEILHGFFEDIIQYSFRPKNLTHYQEFWFDNYRFITYELFLGMITIFINYKSYDDACYFLNELYAYKENNHGNLIFTNFAIFNMNIATIEYYRNKRLGTNFISQIGEVLKERYSNSEHIIAFNQIIETDFILFLHSYINDYENKEIWQPKTYVHASYNTEFPLLERAKRHKYFAILAKLLNVSSKEEMLEKFNSKKEKIPLSDIYYISKAFYDDSMLFSFDELNSIQK